MSEESADEPVELCRLEAYAEADLLVQVLRDETIPASLYNAGPSAGITGTACLGDGMDRASWASWAVLVPASRREEAERIARDWLSATPVTEDDPGA